MKREPTKLRNLVKKNYSPLNAQHTGRKLNHTSSQDFRVLEKKKKKISEFWEQRDPMSFQRGKKKQKESLHTKPRN